MSDNFGIKNWNDFVPKPIFDEHSEYDKIYDKAWQLAFEHIKSISGMPQNPYMDEAFCDTQIWIWDTSFMSLFCKYAYKVFPGVESFNNFYNVLYGDESLPSVIPTENEPVWTSAVPGVPYEIKIHIADNPPLFAWAEYENVLMSGNVERLNDLLYNKQFLQKHYDWIENLNSSVRLPKVFIHTCLINEGIGYKWEGGASGMDNTPRGRTGEHALADRPNNRNMLWFDAICQQALSAKMISKLFSLVGDKEQAKKWNLKFEDKKEIINTYYWDDTDKFYYDIDFITKDFYKVKTVASFWALTSETATVGRADFLSNQVLNTSTFCAAAPFLSLSRDDNDYSPNGKYWRGSIWLPTAYATLKGLTNYGYYEIAHDSALKLLDHMYKTYVSCEPHTIWECYNPEKHEPAKSTDDKKTVRKDFCGWSALGPISIYIEFVLGFHSIDAFNNVVKWALPKNANGSIGIRGLRFGDIITDIIANNGECYVVTNKNYTLEINKKKYEIKSGENRFKIQCD